MLIVLSLCWIMGKVLRPVVRRARAWTLAGSDAPDHDITADKPLVVDLDASLLTAHSEKELAAPTYKRASVFTPSEHGSAMVRVAPGTRRDTAPQGFRRVEHRRWSAFGALPS